MLVPDNIPVTYRQVSEEVGGMANGLGQNLGQIWDFCEQNGHPHLNAVVINAKTGVPGGGYAPRGHQVTHCEWEEIMQEIRQYPWDGIQIP